jgi:hypothetical protein
MRSLLLKLLVLAGASAMALLLLDLAAARLYAHYKQRPFVREEIIARLQAGTAAEPDAPPTPTALGNDPRVANQSVMLHPYFGYVGKPGTARVNAYGFYGPDPIRTRSPDVLLVAILGGSVADQLVKNAGDVLVDALAEAPRFAGRRIELINLALGGYKQPQQMLVLATLLALGAQFDVVVNLDGFNEIDGAKDNLQDGVNPFFPYTWNLHARQGFDEATALHIAKADLIRSQREALRRSFARWPVTDSAFLLALWDFLDQRQEAALRAETVALHQALTQQTLTPQQSGPPVSFTDDDAMYAEYVEVWARASLEMALLCAGYGIEYVHFLQPNQYLPGSKTLTEEERHIAYDPDVADTGRVATAYPMLIERGRDLRRQHVDFVDLTGLFADELRSVYGDTCCHLNGLGNQLLAEAIGRSLVARAGAAEQEEATEPEPTPEPTPEQPVEQP